MIAAGSTRAPDSRRPTLVRLEVLPGTPPGIVPARTTTRARAHFKDGSTRDVTRSFRLHVERAEPAPVTHERPVVSRRPGEASILVRYLDRITQRRLTYVRSDPAFVFKAPPPANYIDEHVFAKQRELQLQPRPVATDEVSSPRLSRHDRRVADSGRGPRVS